MRRALSLHSALFSAWILGTVGCEQELVVPGDSPGASSARPTAPVAPNGVLGLGGENSQPDESGPPLPVKSDPSFTNFGGAAGDANTPDGGASGEPAETAPDSDKGGQKPPSGGAGSQPAGGKGGASAAGGKGGASAAGGKGGASAAGGSLGAGEDAAGGASAGASEASGPRSLIFSEYLEGSGSNKALEISAFVTSSLEGCWLATYFNGKTEPALLALHGSLAAGTSMVLCSSALATAEPSRCQRSTNLTYNGDDALALACDGEVLDVIGQIGFDPGTAWGSGATLDHTLRRNCNVTRGDTNGSDVFEPALEWQLFPIDTVADLGERACATP